MTSAEGFALGVDLGTSHTVAVLRWPDGRTRTLLFDGVPLLPSAVYLAPDGLLHVGRDALRMAALDPARLEPNPKRHIDEATVLLGTVEVSTMDVLAAVLAAVARAAVEAVGFLPPAVLTHPASWGSSRRAVLAGAAAKAGWPPPRLVPEPVAAARYFADVLRRPVPVRGCLAVFDFGAGTLDIAVVQNTGTGFAVLGAGGIENLGGLDVDAALVGHLGSVLAGTPVWAGLSRPTTTGQIRDRHRLWEDVRGAKEMLSRTPVAPVPVPGADYAVHLTREELDRVAGPLIQRAVQETGAVIHRCGLRPDQLAGLFLVGGSSRLPIVARLLHAQLGIAPTVLEQPELPVAEGALAEPVVAPVSPPPAPGPAGPPVSAPPPTGRRPWYRRKLAWVAAGVAVAVLAAVAVVAVLLGNPYDEVTFRSDLQPVKTVPAGEGNFYTAFTVARGDHAYLAYTAGRNLQVIRYDLKANRQVSPVTAVDNSSTLWEEPMLTSADVALFIASSNGNVPRTLYGVRWSDGHLWSHQLAGNDQVFAEPGVVVVTDTKNHLVLGLDPDTGDSTWNIQTLVDQYKDDPLTIPVLAPADIKVPTRLKGGGPVGGYSDGRLVQLSGDSQARIIDTRDKGSASKAKGNIGDNQSVALAYDGRLYVASSTGAHTVSSYDLATFNQSRTTYRPSDTTHTVVALAPCGSAICALDVAKSDAKTSRVHALDPAADNKELWQAEAPNSTLMVPFGDGALVQDKDSGEENTVLLGPGGKDRMGGSGKGYLAARLTNGSALLLAGTPSTSAANTYLSGFGMQRGTVSSIGQAPNVRSQGCSWTTTLLVCPGDKSFGIWRFAS